MEKKQILDALREAKEGKKRNFSQSIDLIINLKGINIKNTENTIDFYMTLPKQPAKKFKIAAIVDAEMVEEAKKTADTIITKEQLTHLEKNKKEAKKLANKNDYFIAQANVMKNIATTLGRVLGPKGKMPNPKAGAVFPPKTQLKPLYEKMQKTIRINNKSQPILHARIGEETMKDEDIVENAIAIYKQTITALPGAENNIKSILLKTTMGKSVKIK